jgi:hypothetical protein
VFGCENTSPETRSPGQQGVAGQESRRSITPVILAWPLLSAGAQNRPAMGALKPAMIEEMRFAI